MIHFLQTRIWAHLPSTVKDSHRRWAVVLWGGGMLAVGLISAWLRHRKGVPLGTAPFVWGLLGIISGVILLTRGAGSAFYLWVLRIFAIPGFIISLALLTLGFYVVLTPMGLLMRLFGSDLLRTGPRSRPEWITHPGPPDRKRFYRLF